MPEFIKAIGIFYKNELNTITTDAIKMLYYWKTII